MYRFGNIKYMDYIYVILVWLLLLVQQRNLIWHGYARIWYSYHKYSSNQGIYKIVNAEVIDIDRQLLAGIDGILSWDIHYCIVRYEYNGITYIKKLKSYPEVSEKGIIKVAVYISDPQQVERIEPYPITEFHWAAQMIYLTLDLGLLFFTKKLTDHYRHKT
ncbi:MAG: hypothetical protein IJ661_10290 [Lachnospiraceae bacterium]|nr:hypothetical protein [Lachnospiraceae bacterium]